MIDAPNQSAGFFNRVKSLLHISAPDEKHVIPSQEHIEIKREPLTPVKHYTDTEQYLLHMDQEQGDKFMDIVHNLSAVMEPPRNNSTKNKRKQSDGIQKI